MKQDYFDFVEKFKLQKTTDDCYTPTNVYEAVKNWVFLRYGLPEGTEIIRPFWPGANYETADYPDGCVVIDNPPFSIMAQIVDFYNKNHVRYFLFAPYLSNIGIGRGLGCCHVIAPWRVRYENGAEVATSFVTNLDPEIIAEAAPDLRALIGKADNANRAMVSKPLPKYDYPDAVLTSTALGYLATHGTVFKVKRGECAFIRKLDEQGDRAIFGGGLLLSERAAAERAAAERVAAERAAAERVAAERVAAERAAERKWQLSPREREIQRMIVRAMP
jgi:hypothetical protein